MAPRSPKQRRQKRKQQREHPQQDDPEEEEPAFVGLDALALVMDFLAPRDLYRLAFTCQRLMHRVSIPQVVKSALFHEGRPPADHSRSRTIDGTRTDPPGFGQRPAMRVLQHHPGVGRKYRKIYLQLGYSFDGNI